MSTVLSDVLRMVALTGGSQADGEYLRHQLGAAALGLKKELRQVELGCADPLQVEHIREVAESIAA